MAVIPPSPKCGSRRLQIGSCFIHAAFACLLFWPLVTGRTLYWGDIDLYFLPMYAFARKSLLAGHIPLWNPLIMCGQPYVGNPQTSVFYPATVGLIALTAPAFISISTIVHIALCGIFTQIYLRRWTASETAALCGGLVYMGSAALVGRAQFPPMIATAPYLPVLLICVDRIVDRPSIRISAFLALAVGLAVLAAHPQLAYLALACASFYAIARLVQSGRAGREFRPVALRLALMLCGLAGGVLMASVQVLPDLQLMLASSREHMTPGQANRFVLTPAHLLTLLWPWAVGHPSRANYWGGGNAWEPAIFVGWTPLFFLAYVLLKRRRAVSVRFWTWTFILCVWLAFGTAGGLYFLAFYAVPGVSKFHDPARFLIPGTFAIAVLAARGSDLWLARRNPGSAGKGLLVAATALPLIVFGPVWNPTMADGASQSEGLRLRTALRSGVGATGRVYEPEHDVLGIRYIADGYVDYGDSDPYVWPSARAGYLPNMNMWDGIPAVAGYEPVPVADVATIDGLARFALRRGEPNFDRLALLLNAQVVLTPASVRLNRPDMGISNIIGPLDVHQNQQILPPAWLVHCAREIQGDLRLSAALGDAAFDPLRVAIVSEPVDLPAWQDDSRSSDKSVDAVKAVTLQPERHVFEVDAGDQPGLLVASDTAYPGWQAFVDGGSARAIRADVALIAVTIPAGSHRVEFRYEPQSYRVGLFATGCALMGISLVTVTCWPKRALERGKLSRSL